MVVVVVGPLTSLEMASPLTATDGQITIGPWGHLYKNSHHCHPSSPLSSLLLKIYLELYIRSQGRKRLLRFQKKKQTREEQRLTTITTDAGPDLLAVHTICTRCTTAPAHLEEPGLTAKCAECSVSVWQ